MKPLTTALACAALTLSTVAFAEGSTHAVEGACLTADSSGDHDGARDFDFLSGRSWKITSRKRVGRFVRSDRWEEVQGLDNSRRIAEVGMIDEVSYPEWRPGYKLVILRTYDAAKHMWTIYDAHNPKNVSPPLYGRFQNGLGLFVGDDTIDGKPVKVRYIWTCDWTHPRYQQEFSNDGGKSWEIDWQMEFTEDH